MSAGGIARPWALDAGSPNWKTINGAHVPLDDDGELSGNVGEKIRKAEERKPHESRPLASTAPDMDRYQELLRENGGNAKKAAHKYFKEKLQDTHMEAQTDKGPVQAHFTGGTWKELKKDMAVDPVKAGLLPHVPDIIATGEYAPERPGPQHPDVSVVHTYRKTKDTSAGPKKVVVDVLERKNPEQGQPKEQVYSLNREGSRAWEKRQKESASLAARGRNHAREEKPTQDSVAADEEHISPRFEVVNIRIAEGKPMPNALTFDAAPSARSVDANGFLHVASSHITKATVNPYYGREIPGWERLGLDPEHIYYGFRDPEALRRSLPTWEGLPLHIEHHPDSADEPEKLTRVGAVGKAVWNAPYIDASLTIWDREAIDAIEDGSFRELSCAYRYEPDFTAGRYEGVEYDFVMRNIRGNHVALVEEGRAGPDVVVADAALDAKRWCTSSQGKHFEVDTESGEITKGNVGQAEWDSPAAQESRRNKVAHAMREIVNGNAEATIPGLRNDLEQYGGTNDVTIIRGDEKKGLVHIERRHGNACIAPVLEAVANGKITRFVEGNKTVHIDKDGYRAVLSLEEHGKKKTWLLTGYDIWEDSEKKTTGDSGKVSARHAATHDGPILSRPDMGAVGSFNITIGQLLEKSRTPLAGDRAPTQTHKPNLIKGAVMRMKNWFRGAKDAAPGVERQEVDLAQVIIDLHKVDPKTGEVVDITEDEDKAAEIRKLLGSISSKLDPDDVEHLTDALKDLAYSKATGDAEPDDEPGGAPAAMDDDLKKAMDACGLDADDEDAQEAFAEGVKYGEGLMRNPAEREKLDREHESEGLKKAMDSCGLDAENPQESRAFAEGVKYGEKLQRNPAERKKLDREHEAEGMKKAMGKDEDKAAAIRRILDSVPGLTPEQRAKLESGLADLAYDPATGDEDLTAQDRALRRRPHGRRTIMASDAALIEARAVARAQDNMRAITKAVRDVRPLVGELDALAFDSAANVYGYALQQSGVDARGYSRSAWRGMVEMLLREKQGLYGARSRMAQDRAPARYDGPFKGLNNINVG